MKLWLIRHAKSGWTSDAGSDFDRPLDLRGEQDGPRMAGWLAVQANPAQWIWCSDALRARRTAQFVADGFAAAAPQVVEDHRLYNATADALLDVLRETPADAAAAAIVGHNPGMTVLANLIAGTTVAADLPTFGVVRLELPESWADLAYGQGSVELYASPRTLFGAVK